MKPKHKWHQIRVKPFEVSEDDPYWIRYKQYRESLGIEMTSTARDEWEKALRSINSSLGMRVTDSY